jgi:hypothetical protein
VVVVVGVVVVVVLFVEVRGGRRLHRCVFVFWSCGAVQYGVATRCFVYLPF